MSTYCSNELEITGNAALIAAFVAEVENDEELLSLDNILPEPNIGEQLGGPNGWLAWRLAHWGTKWDASEVERTHVARTCVTYFYETSWGPAITPVREASRRNPELTFTLSFASAGGNFAGNVVLVGGNIREERLGTYSDICVDGQDELGVAPGYEAWRGPLSIICAALEPSTSRDAAEEVRRVLAEDGPGSVTGIEDLLLMLGDDRLLQEYFDRPDVDSDAVWRLTRRAVASPLGGAALTWMRANASLDIAVVGRLASHLYAALRAGDQPDEVTIAERCGVLRERIALAEQRGDLRGYVETVMALSAGWGGDDLGDFLDAALELHF